MLVCDDKKNITYYQLGFPGSVFDNDIWKQSKVYKTPELYFSQNEFTLSDAGFACTLTNCAPYRQPAASVPINQQFNHHFSVGRVIIEHVNGLLKARWASLKGITTQIRRKKDIKLVVDWTLCCLVLHNLMNIFNDEWHEVNEEVVNEEVFNEDEIQNGYELRIRVQINLLNWVNNKNSLNNIDY